MTQKQKKIKWWTIGSIITIGSLIWGASAWATEIQGVNDSQDLCIIAGERKDEIIDDQITEIRTRMTIAEGRIEAQEERYVRETRITNQRIEQIYQWMMEDRQ